MADEPKTQNGIDGSQQHSAYFEEQREALLQDIRLGLESVLQNLNRLNRSLEGVTSVGSEFSAVEALWSHFESVMAEDPRSQKKPASRQQGA